MKQQLKILYIDDNHMDRALVRDSLEREQSGFELTEAKNQFEFEKLIQTNKYDLILSDFNILGFEGLQVLEIVQIYAPTTPVILVTGTGSEEIAVEAMKRGAADYVIKTASHITRLPNTIHTVLATKKLNMEKEKVQKELLKINRVYAVISHINKLIVRTNERDKLFHEACQIAIIHGGFDMAWIGLWDDDSGNLKPYCWAESEKSSTENILASKSDPTHLFNKPFKINNKTEDCIVCNDISKCANNNELKKLALKNNYQSFIALNIKINNENTGVFCIFSNEKKFFDTQEINLLKEVTEDISFALSLIKKDQDRLKTELDLQISEKQLIKAQEISHVGSWYLNIATNEVVWTSELYKMYGFDPTLPPPPYTEHMKLFTPESWKILSTELDKTAKTGIPYELELKTVKENGKNGWMWVRGEAIKDENDNIIGLWGAAQDITERKKTEERLRKSIENEKELADIVRLAPIAIAIGYPDGKLDKCNAAYLELTGYTFDELKHIRWNNELTPQKWFNYEMEILSKLNQNNSIVQYKKEYKHKNGQIIPVELTVSAHFDSNGAILHYVGFINDISERERAKVELIQAKQKAEESDHLKSAFLANMSHEIRTPMNSIIGFANQLKKPDLSNEHKDLFLSYIQNNASLLMNLINDILDISKIESNQLTLKFESIPLNDILNQVVENYRDQSLNSINCKFTLNFPHDSDTIYIETDKVRLTQVLNNLINNGVKYGNGEIEIGYTIFKQFIQFFVKDNGNGIPQNKFELIFERFSQLNYTPNIGGVHGVGLGLSICKLIIDKLNGKIWVESEIGKGSIFYFRIPIKK